MDKKELEEGAVLHPKFGPDGLLPAVAIDAASGEALMLAYMNETALQRTIETGEATYWSRSRQELWIKGATSGHVQKVREMRIDCDQDAVVLLVDQTGPACHTQRPSCFYRRVGKDGALSFVNDE